MLMRGWRIFWCDECGERWESASRDHASPSGEDCQRCGEWVFPQDSRPDDTLPVDEFGNLTQSYDRVNLPPPFGRCINANRRRDCSPPPVLTSPLSEIGDMAMAKTNATPEWIPVGVRLPDANQSVLVCFGTQVTIAVRYLDEWTTDDGGMLKAEWVSHWMPLPELPAVDERATIQSSKRTNKVRSASQTPYGVE